MNYELCAKIKNLPLSEESPSQYSPSQEKQKEIDYFLAVEKRSFSGKCD